MRVLLLAGTSEARELAQLLVDADVEVVSSLAGRVERPRLPPGPARIGGFGGVTGLTDWLRNHRIHAVIDASHPVSEGMSHHAVTACADLGLPLLRLERPGWEDAPAAGGWHWVGDHDEAATLTASLGRRPLLTVGRQPLDRYVGPLADHDALARVADEPELELPPRWRVVVDRGPYDVDSEAALMSEHAADVLVTKDAGGSYTWPKMAAAARVGLPVVVVRRGTGAGSVPTVSDPTAAVAWLTDLDRPQ